MKSKKSQNYGEGKAKQQSINPPRGKGSTGAPFNDQDAKRRLGNFETAGEHARQGGRTTGVVGQKKQKFRTDKRS